MKTSFRIIRHLGLLALLSTLNPQFSTLHAQGTAFTYQGQLKDNGLPANGNYDLRFGIFAVPTDGLPQGATIVSNPTFVSNGLFAVTLDFGAAAFTGADRWLYVGVRTNGSVAAYTELLPRPLLTATPYAIRAANFSGTVSDSQLSTNVARLNNANQAFSGPVTFNGIVESLSGGFRFPDGSLQTEARPRPSRIMAAVDMKFSQDDRSGWTHVEVLGDNTCFGSIPLGFTYNGFGVSISQVSLSSNGILFFGNSCSSSSTNGTLPSGISNDAMLFFFWDDLIDFGGAEYFEYATFGAPGGRVFNLYFRNHLLSPACGSPPSGDINVMISIHEGSGLVKATYSGFAGCAETRGSSATLGFQTAGGVTAAAFTVGVNSPVLDDNSPSQSMSFHPPN